MSKVPPKLYKWHVILARATCHKGLENVTDLSFLIANPDLSLILQQKKTKKWLSGSISKMAKIIEDD